MWKQKDSLLEMLFTVYVLLLRTLLQKLIWEGAYLSQRGEK